MTRRECLKAGAAMVGGVFVGGLGQAKSEGIMTGQVMTVTGPVAPDKMGFVLTHEHVLVDFVGADLITKDRYQADDVFQVVLPYLKQAKDLGCHTFVECTPSFIGKDPVLLKRLSEATGILMLTNTGYYGAANDKYVPKHAYDESADQLSARWVKEWEEGIEGTGIRPGFIKIGVDRDALSEIDQKLVRAAARAHLKTGLTVMSHTGFSTPAHEEIAVLREEGVHPGAWIWTHAQNEKDNEQHKKAAEAGAWIAFDGVNKNRLERDLVHLKAMKNYGLLDRVLLSHDAGWYEPGKPNGGVFRPFVDLFETFLPALKDNGFSEDEIHKLTVENPKRAFAVAVREV